MLTARVARTGWRPAQIKIAKAPRAMRTMIKVANA